MMHIQDYTKQDKHKHGTRDGLDQDGLYPKLYGFCILDASLIEVKLNLGAKEDIYASRYLTLFKDCSIDKLDEYTQYLDNFLRMTVCKFGYKEGDENDGIFGSDRSAGGTHKDFKQLIDENNKNYFNNYFLLCWTYICIANIT